MTTIGYEASRATVLTAASQTSIASFVTILAAVIGAYAAATFVAARREGGAAAARYATAWFIAGLSLWLGVFSGWVSSGVIAAQPVPFGPLTFAASLAVALAFSLSSAGARLARHTPTWALVAFQGFRLPLEVVLHTWSEQGTIPGEMTWNGSNLDVITGVVALVLAPYASRPGIAWLANVTGLVLLANVGRVAIMSSPVSFGWSVQPPLMLVAYLPYAFIIPVCVAGALAGHVILTRRLLGRY